MEGFSLLTNKLNKCTQIFEIRPVLPPLSKIFSLHFLRFFSTGPSSIRHIHLPVYSNNKQWQESNLPGPGEVLSIDAYPVHYFIYKLSPIVVLPHLLIGSSINKSMEDINEGIEEGSKGDHNTKGKGNPGITQESLEQYNVMKLLLGIGCVKLALFPEQYNENLVKEFYANLSEEFGNPESPTYGQVYVRRYVIDFPPTNIAHYLSCSHFSDIRGNGLEEEVDFDKWSTTNVTTVLKEKAHLLYGFATRKRINICTIMFRNILRKIVQKKARKIVLPCPCLISEHQLGCRELYLSSNSWVRALDPLVIPKIIALGVVPLSPTQSTQGHTGLCRSSKQQLSKKK
ncbi:hypothetical protein M9H77_26886 [Catharanthus roseus]|uniref:Uncharacterized protein n=1 Tax=Catharanthus roseus TaxID=4058 RepID=A0ACC0AAZ1_CATRO|nr:hypothetical protein M9H77_26886 [Catharanthus roseus]